MGLSRKREKELKRLKSTATDLWDEQREVLDHATDVVREARRQLNEVSREEVVPRVRYAVDNRIRPAVSTSFQATKSVVDDARHKISHDILPGVAAAIGSVLATLETAKDPLVREAILQVHRTSDRVTKGANKAFAEASKKASKAYGKVGSKVGLVKPKPSMGPGGYILIAVGVIAAAGLAYAAWQTLRADDELWVLDETDDTEAPE